MSSIIFTPSTPSPRSYGLSNASSIPSDAVIDLDFHQEQHFESKLRSHFVFQSRDGKIQFNLNLHQFLSTLCSALESEGIVIERMPMVGSQLADVLLRRDRPHKDIDFLVLVADGKNLAHIRDIFLKLLFQFSGARAEGLSNGKIACHMTDGQIIVVNRLSDLFGSGALDALGMHGNIMPITIPLVNFKIDITFAWDLGASCLLSSNSFQGDIYPYLKGIGRLNKVIAADGFDPNKSLYLLQRGFFYLNPGHASKLREGLRGYIHAITTGIFPADYSSESEFLNKWLHECPTVDKKAQFLLNLTKYFTKHYSNDLVSNAAFLINLRTFFASKEFDEKESWLSQFDAFAAPFVGKPRALETALFWHCLESFPKARLDCAHKSAPPRFRIQLPDSSILIESPWRETLALLVSDDAPEIPVPFKPIHSREKILARLMTFESLGDDPVGKLLLLIIKRNRNGFVVEFIRNHKKLSREEVLDFEKLWSLFTVKSRFPFGLTQLDFLQGAMGVGFIDQAKMALSFIELPLELTESQAELIGSIATDLASMKVLAKKWPEISVKHLSKKAPSTELFDLIRELSLAPAKWPESWLEFFEQNPKHFKSLIQCATFQLFHLEVACRLAAADKETEGVRDFLVDKQPTLLAPSKDLFKLIKDRAPEKWSPSWISFIEQNPNLYCEFVDAETFSHEFKVKATARLLKVDYDFDAVWLDACRSDCLPDDLREVSLRFKKAKPQDVSKLTQGLLALFESNPILAAHLTRTFFLTVSFNSLEKADKDLEVCWALLQLSSGRTRRRVKLSIQELVTCFKIIVKSENEILPFLSTIIKDPSLTVDYRINVVADLFAFTKFIHPKLQLANRASFPQNFFSLVINLFQEAQLMEKRMVIFHLLSTFSPDSPPLVFLMQAAELRFNECLVPMAKDFIGHPELLKHFVHWLLGAREQLAEAGPTLQFLAPLLRKSDVALEDAAILFRDYEMISEEVIDLVLSESSDAKKALDFLRRQIAPYSYLLPFEKFALKVKDWTFAVEIAFETQRLGGVDLLPQIFSRRISMTSDQIPQLEKMVQQGVDVDLLWRAALPSFSEKNIPFQMRVGKICSSKRQSHEIGLYFSSLIMKKSHPSQLIELIQSNLIPIAPLWNAIKSQIRDPKILQAVIDRLSKSTDYEINFRILAELVAVIKPHDLSTEATKLFIDQIQAMKDLPQEAFWRALRPLVAQPTILAVIPLAAWHQVFELSLEAFRSNLQDNDLINLLPKLADFLAQRFTLSTSYHQFLKQLIELSQIISSEATSVEQIWAIIKLIPANRVHTNHFFDRLEKSKDYRANFKVLSSMVQLVPVQYLQNRPSELFKLYLSNMGELSFSQIWTALQPLLQVPRSTVSIPPDAWDHAFSLSLKKLELNEDKESNVHQLSILTASLIESNVWNEGTFLFVAKALDASTTNYTHQAKTIWETLVSLATKTIKTAEGHDKARQILSQIQEKLSVNAIMILSPEFIDRLNWLQNPLLTIDRLLSSLEALLANPPDDFGHAWLNLWAQMTKIDLKIEDFEKLIKISDLLFAQGDPSLSIASAFMLAEQFTRHISLNPKFNLPNFYSPVVEGFHRSFQKFYEMAPHLQVSEEANARFPYAAEVDEFSAKPENLIEMSERIYSIAKLPHTHPKGYLMTRIVGIHALIISLGRQESAWNVFLMPTHSTWAKELFQQFKLLNFFNYYEKSSFVSILQSLSQVLCNGSANDTQFLMSELTALIKYSPLLSQLSLLDKQSLFAAFLTDIMILGDSNTYKIHTAAFEFTKEALVTPEWGVRLEIGAIQFAYIQFLITFNHCNDAARALESGECIIPVVTKYTTSYEQFQNEISKKKETNAPEAEYHELLLNRVEAVIEGQELERAVEMGLKIPALKKLALGLGVKTKELKKYRLFFEKKKKEHAQILVAAAASR